MAQQQQQSHYSLRWNNHQSHILSAFDALLQAETLVDVTLVCAETSVRAHKVVLSACSPFFQRIFSENPCKHPVIVLKDFSGWEVQAIVDFMYKGEISVIQEQLQSLIKAAESLQVRGLANQDHFGAGTTTSVLDKESSSITNQTPTPSLSPNDFERNFYSTNGRLTNSQGVMTVRNLTDRSSPSFSPGFEMKLPHMPQLNFPPENLMASSQRNDCQSPIPRRKQARPRRRSGEMMNVISVAQDLSAPKLSTTPPLLDQSNTTTPISINVPHQPMQLTPTTTTPLLLQTEDMAENLCMKKSSPMTPPPAVQPSNPNMRRTGPSEEEMKMMSPVSTTRTTSPGMLSNATTSPMKEDCGQIQRPLKVLTPEPSASPELDLSMPSKDYAPSPPLSLPPMSVLNALRHEMESHSPLHFPPMPSVSALTMTPPHSKFFGLDSPLGLFPPGLDGCRNPLLDLTDPRTPSDTPMFVKKKMGRPKGQHSAPRGGPPRSWTNAELTEALQHVWNKKMTTSQASRIFGIPYNSLLMYVRGKYGKSLKLEQLRRDCIGGPVGPLDLLGLAGSMGGPGSGSGNNNNNNKTQSERDHQEQLGHSPIPPNTRPSSVEDPHQPPGGGGPPPLFNPFAPGGGFYPDFGGAATTTGATLATTGAGAITTNSGGFPPTTMPVNMIHLLPPHHQTTINSHEKNNHNHHHHHHHPLPPYNKYHLPLPPHPSSALHPTSNNTTTPYGMHTLFSPHHHHHHHSSHLSPPLAVQSHHRHGAEAGDGAEGEGAGAGTPPLRRRRLVGLPPLSLEEDELEEEDEDLLEEEEEDRADTICSSNNNDEDHQSVKQEPDEEDEEEDDIFMDTEPPRETVALLVADRRELVQENGQD